MNKFSFFFAFFLLLTSCSNLIEPVDIIDDSVAAHEDLKRIQVTVSLPNNSVPKKTDLLISSLFDEDVNLTGESSRIDVFESNGFEVIMVHDINDEVILLGYFNPSQKTSINIDTKSTATALVMLQPWTIDLSTNAITKAITKIEEMPEYIILVESINNSIITDGKPLDNEIVKSSLELLLLELFKGIDITGKNNTTKNSIVETKKPLKINANQGSLQITNSSSMAYSVKINNQNPVLAKGANKDLFLYTNYEELLSNGSFGSPTTTSINITSSAPINVNCDSGLSGEETSQKDQALQYNIGKIAIGLIGVLSGGVFDGATSDECLNGVGKWAFDNTFDVYKIGLGPDKSNDLVKNLLDFIQNRVKDLKDLLPKCYNVGLLSNKKFEIF